VEVSEMPDDVILRQRAHAAILDGKLPRRNPARIWNGAGGGKTCPVCSLPVTEEKELVTKFVRDGDASAHTFHVHIRCFVAWVAERERMYWS
jgi:hypothetical protein